MRGDAMSTCGFALKRCGDRIWLSTRQPAIARFANGGGVIDVDAQFEHHLPVVIRGLRGGFGGSGRKVPNAGKLTDSIHRLNVMISNAFNPRCDLRVTVICVGDVALTSVTHSPSLV